MSDSNESYMANLPENEQCPVCGYYCLGNGGLFCIDKPTLVQKECHICKKGTAKIKYCSTECAYKAMDIKRKQRQVKSKNKVKYKVLCFLGHHYYGKNDESIGISGGVVFGKCLRCNKVIHIW